MGFFDKAKSFFNIGGVTVKLSGVDSTITWHGAIRGTATLTAESDKDVLSTKASLMLRRTIQRNDGPEIHDRDLVQKDIAEPFRIRAGEQKFIDFEFAYAMEPSLRAAGGLIGGMARLMSSDSEQLFVVVRADVKGTALDPSDKVRVTVKP